MSAFYDMEILYKPDKNKNNNALHISSLLDKKAVGAPFAATGSGSAFFHRNSSSNVEVINNGNKYSVGPYENLKDATSSNATALMNKENKFRDRAFSESAERGVPAQKAGAQVNSTRYKTELCRPFEESGSCKYGEKCQFAHGYHELRSLSRHPKYKTEPCRTFHTIGFCPYGPRCHFIHNADERRPGPDPLAVRNQCSYSDVRPPRDRPKLQHSLSFSGFSSHHGLDSPLLHSPASRTPPRSRTPPPTRTRPPSSCSLYEKLLSPGPAPFSLPGQDLRALLAPLVVHPPGYSNNSTGAYYTGAFPPSPPNYNLSHLAGLRHLSESPVFESSPSPPDSLSDRESSLSGSLSSSDSLSGSESPGLDAGRRLPIFSRLSISDD